jgi:hypothetical protein
MAAPLAIPLVSPLLSAAGGMGQLGGLINLLGLGTTAYYMAGGGQPSQEEQDAAMRRQLEIQDEFERERMGSGDQMTDSDVLGGGMSLSGLLNEERRTRMVGDIGRDLDTASRSRGFRMSPELEQLIGASSVRIAELQSERVLTPIEIIQMAESI